MKSRFHATVCRAPLHQAAPRRCLHTTGNIYHTAKDQYGCRFLQKMLEDGNPQCIARILEEVRAPSRLLGPIGIRILRSVHEPLVWIKVDS